MSTFCGLSLSLPLSPSLSLAQSVFSRPLHPPRQEAFSLDMAALKQYGYFDFTDE